MMENYNILVHKYGGSSLADLEKLKIVANNIVKELEENNKKSIKNGIKTKIIAVVSAQGKMTNKLIEEKEEVEINDINIKLEHDKLITVGEQITASKLSILLCNMGYSARSLSGFQIPIITDNNFTNANIVSINTNKFLNEFEKYDILIVTGFCGVTNDMEITTLGRGGSDTTATFIANSLNTNCYIFTDVDGIYTADPRVVKNAFKKEIITYDQMIEYSKLGAKVLHYKCLEIPNKDTTIIYSKEINKNGTTKGSKITNTINYNLNTKSSKDDIISNITGITVFTENNKYIISIVGNFKNEKIKEYVLTKINSLINNLYNFLDIKIILNESLKSISIEISEKEKSNDNINLFINKLHDSIFNI